MNPGRFNNIIKFYTPSKSADGYGGFTSSGFTLNATLWGDAKEISGDISQSQGVRKYNRVSEVILRKKDFDTITQSDFVFEIDGVGKYRVNDYYNMIEKKYIKLIGTYEPI